MGFLKKITRPIRKIVKKIVPRELQPLLPVAAAFLPIAPGIGGLFSGIKNPLLQAALKRGTQSALAQSVTGEGDVDPFTTAMAGLSAGLSEVGSAGLPEGLKTTQSKLTGEGVSGLRASRVMESRNILQQAGDIGKSGIMKVADVAKEAGPFKTAAATSGIIATKEAYDAAQEALDEYNRGLTEQGVTDDSERIKLIRQYMSSAGFDESQIESALGRYGYLAAGGRVGFQQGGTTSGLATIEDYRKALENVGAGTQSQKMQSLGEYSRSMATRDFRQAAKGGGLESFLTGQLGSEITPYISMMQSPMSGTSNFGRELVLNALTSSYMKPYAAPTDSAYDQMRFAAPGQSGSFVAMPGGQFGDGMGIVIDGKQYATEQEAINDVGLERYNMFYADGGRVGLETGGTPEDNKKTFADYEKEERIKEFTNLVDKLMTDEGIQDKGYAIRLASDLINMKNKDIDSDRLKFLNERSTLFALPTDKRPEPEYYDALDALEKRVDFQLGGRVGLEFGGMPEAVEKVEEEPQEFMIDKLKVTVQPGQSEQMAIMNAMMNDVEGVMPEDRKQEFYRLYLPQLRQSGEISETQYEGLMNELFGEEMQNGGIMNLKGKEMDLRGGGFVPIGAKERADDVPARLSKNEFVFTADAVRSAGGGSVQKGAEKMYNTMKMLEGKIA